MTRQLLITVVVLAHATVAKCQLLRGSPTNSGRLDTFGPTPHIVTPVQTAVPTDQPSTLHTADAEAHVLSLFKHRMKKLEDEHIKLAKRLRTSIRNRRVHDKKQKRMIEELKERNANTMKVLEANAAIMHRLEEANASEVRQLEQKDEEVNDAETKLQKETMMEEHSLKQHLALEKDLQKNNTVLEQQLAKVEQEKDNDMGLKDKAIQEGNAKMLAAAKSLEAVQNKSMKLTQDLEIEHARSKNLSQSLESYQKEQDEQTKVKDQEIKSLSKNLTDLQEIFVDAQKTMKAQRKEAEKHREVEAEDKVLNQKLEAQLMDASNAVKSLTDDKQSLMTNVQNLLAEQQAQKDKPSAEAEELKKEKEKEESLVAQVKDNQMSLDAKTQAMYVMQSEIAKMNNTLAEVTAKDEKASAGLLDELNRTTSQYFNEVRHSKKMQDKVNELEHQKSKLESKLKEAVVANRKVTEEKEFQELKNDWFRVKYQPGGYEKLQASNAKEVQAAKNLLKENEELKLKIKHAKADAEKDVEEIPVLKLKLAADRKEMDAWKEKVTKANIKFSDEEAQVNGLKARNKQLAMQVDLLDKVNTTKIFTKDDITEKFATEEKLNMEKGSLETQLKDAQSKIKRLELEAAVSQSLSNRKKDNDKAVQDQLNGAQAVTDTRTRQMWATQKKNTELKDQLDLLKHQNENLQKENQKLQASSRHPAKHRRDIETKELVAENDENDDDKLDQALTREGY